jgi:hypothetical protein
VLGTAPAKLHARYWQPCLNAKSEQFPVGDEIMWNSRKYTAMAVLCAGLAVAATTSSSAQSWGGAYGYAGGCGISGSGPASYAGVYTYGWPYGVIGDVGCPAYGYVGGGAYGSAGGYTSLGYAAYGYASGYGPYGYALNTDAGSCGGYGAYGSAPLSGFAGACRARRNHHGYGGYVEARRIVPNNSMRRHVVSVKQAGYLDR